MNAWRVRCREEWGRHSIAGITLDVLLESLQEDAERLMEVFAQQAITEDEKNSALARHLLERYSKEFDEIYAYEILSFLIRTTAAVYQDKFGDFEGGQYPRLISPNAIIGDKAAFSRVRASLSSAYVEDGGLKADCALLERQEICSAKELEELLSKFKGAVGNFYKHPKATMMTVNKLLGDLHNVGDILEDERVEQLTPNLVQFMNHFEDDVTGWMRALSMQSSGIGNGDISL